MKKLIIFFLPICIILINCEQKEKRNFFYPSIKRFEEIKNKDTLIIKEFKSYKNITDTLWYYTKHLKNKTPVFITENRNNKYYLKTVDLNYSCLPGIIKIKNIIVISKDSVFKQGDYYSIDSLENILKTDLLNNRKNNHFADSHKKLTIQLLRPYEQSIEELNNQLISLFNIFNDINKKNNDTLTLNIDFEELIILKPPPPPPTNMDWENLE
jgi:hypothetical protein